MILWFILGIVVCCCAGMLALVRRALAVITIQGGSMLPELNPGDRLLIYRWYPRGRLRCGQVVLLTSPGSSQQQYAHLPSAEMYIKRIVGLGGEDITTSITELHQVHRKEQELYYNARGYKTWHIPEGYIFVCGDNRRESVDSRLWGPISRQNVLGVVLTKLSRASSGSGQERQNVSMLQ